MIQEVRVGDITRSVVDGFVRVSRRDNISRSSAQHLENKPRTQPLIYLRTRTGRLHSTSTTNDIYNFVYAQYRYGGGVFVQTQVSTVIKVPINLPNGKQSLLDVFHCAHNDMRRADILAEPRGSLSATCDRSHSTTQQARQH